VGAYKLVPERMDGRVELMGNNLLSESEELLLGNLLIISKSNAAGESESLVLLNPLFLLFLKCLWTLFTLID